MPRPHASVPPDAIRIEDEVWQEAFTQREPARPRPQLHAIEGGRATAAPTRPQAEPLPAPPRAQASPAPAPRTAAAGRVPGRRTVTIRGHGAERNLPWP